MSKRLIALPVAMLAVAVFAPGIANAANFNTTTTFAIQSGGGGFQGKVGSPKSSCIPNRTVTLLRKPSGATKFSSVGTDKTDNNGNWSINTNPQVNAQYVASVSKKSVSGGTCLQKNSTTLTARQTKSTISIAGLGNSFKGKVTTITACVNARTVKLQRNTGSGFVNIGSPDTTSSNGSWEIATNPINNAQYRGSVSAKTVGTTACMAAKSPVTTAHSSSVSIVQGGSTNFHGTVTSVTACKANRTVTLQRKTIYDTTFHDIGSDATDTNGNWLKSTAVISGASYRASVSARQQGSNSCLPDLSNIIVAS